MKLTLNQEVVVNNTKYIVAQVFGEGGQGEVYLVKSDTNEYALKLYKDVPSDDFLYNLKENIFKGSPCNTFIWPKEFVQLDNNTYGYIMDVRPNRFKSFVKYLNGAVKFKDTKVMIRFCIQLCQSFKKLHEMGYSYQDLNDGSFFFDPDNGDLLICDNDNVTANKKNLGILGKMRYMAPEIVRGEEMPDVHSDRFSLAIILFLTLCLGNPFEGERLKDYDFIDEVAEFEMFGKNPIYVYHKDNCSNRPIRGYHQALLKRYPLLPLYIKEAFHKTFVDGLKDRENQRVTELEWLKLLTKYRDELIKCSCGNLYAYGLYETNQIRNCPYCNQAKPSRARLIVNKRYVLLDLHSNIYKDAIDKYSNEYDTVIGSVIQSKNNQNIWGIKLQSDKDIDIKDSSGNVKTISKSNCVIPILSDLKIKFSDETAGQIKR